jgi:hypothetical protein
MAANQIEEPGTVTGFPGAKYDDQVDSTTQALQFIKEGSDALEKWRRFGEALPPVLEGPFGYRSAYLYALRRGRW